MLGRPLPWLAVSFLSCLVAWSTGVLVPHPAAQPARLVVAEISVEGSVVLRGTTSDDGLADVDEVWDYLLERLRFAPARDLATLGVAPDAQGFTLRGAEQSTGRPGQRTVTLPTITLDVHYGGTARVRELRLERSASAPAGAEWRVAPDEVPRHFAQRTITRSAAASLKHPERLR